MKRNRIKTCRRLRRNQTDAEKKLWTLLRARQLAGTKFRRQFSIGNYIVDFYSPEYKLGIEADGGGHYEDKGKERDALRTRALNALGVEIMRFSDREILTNIEGVYEIIKKTIEEKKNSPPHLFHPDRNVLYKESTGRYPLPPGERRIAKNLLVATNIPSPLCKGEKVQVPHRNVKL